MGSYRNWSLIQKAHNMPRKYARKASEKVEKAMHEMKEGKLKSGGSGKKVTNPRQAIAIGLSEAREAGAKVSPRRSKATTKKTGSKRSPGNR